ncbi:MAG: DNA-directed RNA polymerase subunit G [Candidatus Odinarchaeum yellowstonii]|uniref:DNA-directed RNA polymerase subunit G n=1 Tax=Odinarchaeota yellowstonii (strain LCB_4) TaxID=1841599 RepID=A0AAF0D3E9_ODILC|nr:MAG: DNA-directed RNA polymerase subunit G [Candidatus Odinarchaeum yellowstonii]
MASFTAIIKNISPTDNENIIRLEAETDTRDKIFVCELPRKLNTFNKDDRVELTLDYSKPPAGGKADIEMTGKIYSAETLEDSTALFISFSGLLSKFTFPTNYFPPHLKKTIYLAVKKI